MSFEVDMPFTSNGIHLQMTLAFKEHLKEYGLVVKLCELWNSIHLTWPWSNNLVTQTWSSFEDSKIIAWTDTHTDTQTDSAAIINYSHG